MLNFEASPAALARGLAALSGVTGARNTIPILYNVRLDGQTATQRLVATVTDMDLESTVEIEANVRDSGSTTASYRQLCRIAGNFRESSAIELRDDEDAGRMHVSAALSGLDLGLDDGAFKATVRTLPTVDFPAMRALHATVTVTATAGEWLKVLECLRPFISTEPTRFYLNGVHLAMMPGADGRYRWEAAATDGHILGRVRFGIPGHVPFGGEGFIIPRAAVLHMIQRLRLVPAGDDVTMDIGDGGISVRFPGRASGTMVSKLIDGTFPDYNRVIPDQTNAVADIDSRRLGKVIRTAVGASGAKTPSATIKLGLSTVMDFMLNGDGDETEKTASVPLPICWGAGSLEIGMNLKLLTHGLAMMDGGEAKMQVTDGASPVRFDAVAPPDGMERTAVAMPMRV